jgi:Flp pilus assembly protein TadD
MAGDEEIWPVQLEAQLTDSEVFNLAVHGYGNDQQLLVLEHEGVKYGPDVVVLGCFVEDVFRNNLAFRDYAKPMFVLQDSELILTNTPVPTPEAILAQGAGSRPWSYAVHYFRDRLPGRFGSSGFEAISDRQYILALTKAILYRMNRVAASAGAKLLVVIIPSPHFPMPEVRTALRDWSAEIGYAAVDLSESFADAEKTFELPMYFRHLTPLGHLVAATRVREALVDLGWVSGPDDEALAAVDERFRQVVAQHQPSASEYVSFGVRVARNQGQAEQAMGYFRRAIELDDEYVPAYNELAQLCVDTGKLAEAEELYRKAIEVKPTDPVLRTNIASLLASTDRPDEALEHLQKAVEAAPDFFEGHHFIGLVSVRQGQFEQAAAAFRRALELRPDSVQTQFQLALVMVQLRRDEEAVAGLRKVLQLAPNHDQARAVLQKLLSERGAGESSY